MPPGWVQQSGATAKPSHTVQRGGRYAATVTDFLSQGQLAVTLCEVNGLGYAWSDGTAGHAYSDPQGPDASRMIWAFALKQFTSRVK
jgi:poly(3-hydroxybutyrate) depolymerase